MGLANSAIVDYEDAQRRCVYSTSWDPHHAGTTRELERWSRSFQRFKDKSGFMDKATFTKFVLANSAPPELADSLYRVFSNDQQQQGISWRDFVCNLVVLLKVVTWWQTHSWLVGHSKWEVPVCVLCLWWIWWVHNKKTSRRVLNSVLFQRRFCYKDKARPRSRFPEQCGTWSTDFLWLEKLGSWQQEFR